MMNRSCVRVRRTFLCLALLGIVLGGGSASALSSYADGATDLVGSTGSAAVALGVPDYEFVHDAGIGFAGNTDVFDVGEVAVFSFPTALRAIPSQHDLVISAYVGGLGETDNAQVQVEVSTDGTNFTVVGTFDTAEARDRSQDRQENDHAGVKHFWVDFGGIDFVTHVRLTNLAGTAEGLRLDSIEGLHPVVDADHAFEIRFERYRPDFNQRFIVRIKNISDVGGVPIREFRIDRPAVETSTLEDTDDPLYGPDGDFICIEYCIPDNGPLIPYTRMVWSTDGATEAAPGLGLDPGEQASHDRWHNFDLDTADTTYLSGYTFTVTFADGLVQTFDYDADVLIDEGKLYQKYLYFDANPAESGPRQVDYYEWRRRSVVTFSNPESVGDGHEPGTGGRILPTSQNFTEDGMHVEAFWVPNDSSTFVPGHFHDLENGFERTHGFESTPGLGPDRLGFYLERVDGGAFDLESLDYRLAGSLAASTILISPTYDPSQPPLGQFSEFPVVANAGFETLEFDQFDGVTTLFILPLLSEDSTHLVDWDNLVIATADPITIPPVADAGPDIEVTDADQDAQETVGLDASASSDPDGSLTGWTWFEDGVELGTGVAPNFAFALGRHDVVLEVVDDDGNVDSDALLVQVNPANGVPFADAGPNQNATDDGGGSASVLLDGSDSFDSDGAIVSWEWSEGGVPLGSGETLVLDLSVGVHNIDLLVTDDAANTDTDSLTISITPLGGFPPTADAGMNVTVTDIDTNGVETILLDGSGSSDPDGVVVSWEWSESGVLLGNGETLPIDFPVGIHIVDLVVQDDAGNSAVDSVTITVESGIVIAPPQYVAHETSAEVANTTVHHLGVSTLPILAGDLMVAHICVDGASNMQISCPAGWTEIENQEHASSGVYGALCMKTADASDESATSYEITTTSSQASQSGVILLESQDPVSPLDLSASRANQYDASPESPALPVAPHPASRVLRFMCANAGQVTEGVGFPAGMTLPLWIEESADGFSGPASGGAAVDGVGVSGPALWTDVLASGQQSVNFTLAIKGRAAALTANAGPDVTVTDVDENGTEDILLDGSGSSDFGGSIVAWRWTEGASNLGTGETLAVSLAVGVHDIELEVEDDDGNLATDQVRVTVNPGGMIAPIADAGPDQIVADDDLGGTELVTLDGSGSSDSDGTVVSWTWTEGGSPLANGSMPVVELAIGSHTIDLLVEDDDGNQATDSVVIDVLPGGTPPVADAGPDLNAVDIGDDGFETVTLDASASYDPDGSLVRWSWTENGSPLGEGASVNVAFAVGSHTVDLEVEDDSGLIASDSLVVTVSPPGVAVPAIFLGFQTSEEPSNTTAHTLDVGALPIAAGDLMVAQLCVDGGGSTTLTCPIGWTELASERSVRGGARAAVCYREATPADEGATSYVFTSSLQQESQSSVYLFAGHDTASPIEAFASRTDEVTTSPESPAFDSPPSATSTILRMMCSNAGQVTEGVGFPAGMASDLWVLESSDGNSGPTSGGGAIDVLGATGAAVWTDLLASAQQTIGFSVAIAGGDGAPIASAGPDQLLVDDDENGFEDVLLDGSASYDPNGSLVAWTWRENGMTLGTTEILALSLAVGTHDIQLEVEDSEGNFATDDVQIMILAGGSIAPVADAGSDVSVIDLDESGAEDVLLDGSNSSDADGTIVSWTWSEGPTTLGTGETVAVSFAVGSHTVDLLVEDDDGNTDTASVTITVSPGGGVTYVAHETSFESDNVTSHDLSVASLPIAAGDLMLAHLCADGGGSVALSCPAGWTELDNATHYSGGVVGAVCAKQADASDESATSYPFTTTVNQQSQNGVILIEGHDALTPIAEIANSAAENSASPVSPALSTTPASTDLVIRLVCSNAGRVTEGSGFPSGMANELWVLESGDGGSGPVSGGAAIDAPTASGPAEWTNLLSQAEQSVTFSVIVRTGGGS